LGTGRDAESPGEPSELVHILSPFDPLIIQRKRTHLFFGYEHRFEAYVPKEKRVFGYFALPVLAGDDMVAALDLKTDREAENCCWQKWNWVGTGAQRGACKDLKRRIEEGKRCTASSGFSWRSEGASGGSQLRQRGKPFSGHHSLSPETSTHPASIEEISAAGMCWPHCTR